MCYPADDLWLMRIVQSLSLTGNTSTHVRESADCSLLLNAESIQNLFMQRPISPSWHSLHQTHTSPPNNLKPDMRAHIRGR